MNRRLLYALTATATLFLVCLYQSLPAGADYSDHGTPDVSLVASTHPNQPPAGGSLPQTGSSLEWLAYVGAFVLIAGAALCLASSKRSAR